MPADSERGRPRDAKLNGQPVPPAWVRMLDGRPSEFVKRYRTEIAASMSSVLSTGVAYPLDGIKVRRQTYSYDGFMHCVRHTYQTEKLRGFFRGVAAPMVSVTLVRTVSLSIYTASKHGISNWFDRNFGFDVLKHVHTPGTYPNLYSIACFSAAGAAAGSAITLVACPFELTKLSAQVSVLMADDKSNKSEGRNTSVAASYRNKGTFQMMATIMKNRGPLGLYTGFSLHTARDTLGTAIYFGVYESGKQLVQTCGGDSPASTKLAVVLAGGVCSVVSSIVSYPIDTVKSIFQRDSLLCGRGDKAQPRLKISWSNPRMYNGLGVSVGRTAIVNIIFLSSFEFIKKRIKEDVKTE